MTITNPIVLVLLYHEVIVDISLRRLLQRAQNRASIVLASLGAEQTLCIDL